MPSATSSSLRLIFGFPAPIILSLLINEVAHRHYKKLVQTSVLLPSFISWVIIGGLMHAILSPNSGVLQAALEWFGYRGRIVNLIASKEHFRGVIVATYVWRQWGVGTIIYLAAIASIDPQLYEAATIDGAGRWRQLFSITLPSLRLTIIILLILRVGDLMEAGFEQIFAIYNPLVYEVADHRHLRVQGRFGRSQLLAGDRGRPVQVGNRPGDGAGSQLGGQAHRPREWIDMSRHGHSVTRNTMKVDAQASSAGRHFRISAA